MYVIFNGRIWSSYRAGDGWRAYSGGESHADHIHISLSWSGAAKRTSWWTGKAVGPRLRPLRPDPGQPGAALVGAARDPVPDPRRPDDPDGHAAARPRRDRGVRRPAAAAAVGDAGDRLLRADHRGRADRVPEGARTVGDSDDHPGDLVSPAWRRGREPAAARRRRRP